MSSSSRFYVTFLYILVFSPLPTQAWGPPPVGYPWLLIHHVSSCPSCLFPSSTTWGCAMLWQEETHITSIQQKIYINWFVFDCSHCWESLADAYYGRGAYTSALKSYQRVLELDPDAIYPAFQMGTIKQVSMSSVLWSHLVMNRCNRTYIQWIFCILHLVIYIMDWIYHRDHVPQYDYICFVHMFEKFCFHNMPVMQYSLL